MGDLCLPNPPGVILDKGKPDQQAGTHLSAADRIAFTAFLGVVWSRVFGTAGDIGRCYNTENE